MSSLDKVIEPSLTLKDLYGLQWRVDEAEPSAFFPPNIQKTPYSPNILEAVVQMEEQEKQNSWNQSPYRFSIIDFGTKAKKIKLYFKDNEPNDKGFSLSQPIRLIDLVKGIHAHYKKVGLRGWPDNGIFDLIKKDTNGNFAIYTAS